MTPSPTAAPVPVFTVTPSSFDFGQVAVGASSKTQTFTFKNDGDWVDGCQAALSNSQDFAITTDCAETSNESAKTCSVSVAAKPSTANSKSTLLSLACPGGFTSTTASLAAKGIPALSGPFFVLTNTWFSPTGIGDDAPQNGSAYVTFFNQSVYTLTGCLTPTMNDSTGTFSVHASKTTCGNSSISPWSTCTVYLDAKPTVAGSIKGAVDFNCPLYGAYESSDITITGLSPALLYWTKNSNTPTSNEDSIDLGTFEKNSWPGGVKIYTFNLGDQNATHCQYSFSGETDDFPNRGSTYASTIYSGQDASVFFNFSNDYTAKTGTHSETVTLRCDKDVTAATTVHYRVK